MKWGELRCMVRRHIAVRECVCAYVRSSSSSAAELRESFCRIQNPVPLEVCTNLSRHVDDAFPRMSSMVFAALACLIIYLIPTYFVRTAS